MIIVKLWGGMCNQMFQYAFGYALAKRYHDELKFDIDFYNHQPKHTGKRRCISSGQFALTMMRTTKRPFPATWLENRYVSHIIRYNMGCLIRLPHINFMMERLHKYYTEIPYVAGKVNYYDGYWPTNQYFQDVEDEIRREFMPSPIVLSHVEKWRSSVKSDCCVAVHVRRGDYLNKINQGGVDNALGKKDFYEQAITYCVERLDNPVFCFISDDIEWCRETFANVENAVFVENKGEEAAVIDLFSIAACEHGIMSASTFSWWGNWLRKDSENSIVIMPNIKNVIPHFALDNWILI